MKINDLKKIKGIKHEVGTLGSQQIELTTDSRSINNENVFLALSGERFDAFNFIEGVFDSDIRLVIYEHKDERNQQVEEWNKKFGISFIGVEDTLKFLQDMAAWWIRQWKTQGGTVLGLTGSNGKTTTKELMYGLAKSYFGEKVICTQGNLNNHIGVPLTIMSIKPSNTFAIVEMGTNHHGEIEVLCNIADPDFGFITNIGEAHIEFLGSKEGVFNEKTSLYRYIKENGKLFFVNMEDEYLAELHCEQKTSLFNRENDDLSDIDNKTIEESYNKWNLKSAYYVLKNIFPEGEKSFKKAASEIRLPKNKRSQWIEQDGVTIFLDAYNANPSSMKAAINSFVENDKVDIAQSIFVLGDMNELGRDAIAMHKEVSQLLNDRGAQSAIFIGRHAQDYQSAFNNEAQVFIETNDAKTIWNKVLNTYKFIFVKGSRSLQLESLVDITDP
jgi:UDP-N-acetylmuramoyl-tripeptide--D-alanyl-D-alanine ligase